MIEIEGKKYKKMSGYEDDDCERCDLYFTNANNLNLANSPEYCNNCKTGEYLLEIKDNPMDWGWVNETPTPDRGKELANQHWNYIKSLLVNHKVKNIDKIGFHYITSFIHGYKHGIEDLENEREN